MNVPRDFLDIYIVIETESFIKTKKSRNIAKTALLRILPARTRPFFPGVNRIYRCWLFLSYIFIRWKLFCIAADMDRRGLLFILVPLLVRVLPRFSLVRYSYEYSYCTEKWRRSCLLSWNESGLKRLVTNSDFRSSYAVCLTPSLVSTLLLCC